MNNKVIVIGLDGATWNILDPWLDKLPFLNKLKKQGIYSNLQSTIPAMTAPAWASFQTGKSPGEHGIWGFKTRNNKIVDSSSLKIDRFWKKMEKENKEYCFINLPLAYPLPKAKGIIISSLLTPPGRDFCNHPEIQKMLEKIGYKVDVEMEKYGLFGAEEQILQKKEQIYKQILDVAEKRYLAIKKLADFKDWDFFFALFRATDTVQHIFWKKKQTLQVYKKLDKYLENIYRLFKNKYEDKLHFFVISDHGFHATPKTRFYITPYLQKQKLMPQTTKTCCPFIGLAKMGWRLVKNLAVFKKLKKQRDNYIKKQEKKHSEILDVQPFQNGIFVKDKTKILPIIKALKKLKHNNKKVFKWVKTKQEVYSRSNKNPNVPDVVFLANKEFIVDPDLFAEKLFTKNNPPQIGKHNADPIGIFIYKGKKIKLPKNIKIWNLANSFVEILN